MGSGGWRRQARWSVYLLHLAGEADHLEIVSVAAFLVSSSLNWPRVTALAVDQHAIGDGLTTEVEGHDDAVARLAAHAGPPSLGLRLGLRELQVRQGWHHAQHGHACWPDAGASVTPNLLHIPLLGGQLVGLLVLQHALNLEPPHLSPHSTWSFGHSRKEACCRGGHNMPSSPSPL